MAIVSVVHAMRISHGTRMLSGGTKGQLSLFQSLSLNLINLFGSSSIIGAPLRHG